MSIQNLSQGKNLDQTGKGLFEKIKDVIGERDYCVCIINKEEGDATPILMRVGEELGYEDTLVAYGDVSNDAEYFEEFLTTLDRRLNEALSRWLLWYFGLDEMDIRHGMITKVIDRIIAYTNTHRNKPAIVIAIDNVPINENTLDLIISLLTMYDELIGFRLYILMSTNGIKDPEKTLSKLREFSDVDKYYYTVINGPYAVSI
jgi:hypothetical protein